MDLTDPIKRGIHFRNLRALARKNGAKTLRNRGLTKTREGFAAMEAMLGVTF